EFKTDSDDPLKWANLGSGPKEKFRPAPKFVRMPTSIVARPRTAARTTLRVEQEVAEQTEAHETGNLISVSSVLSCSELSSKTLPGSQARPPRHLARRRPCSESSFACRMELHRILCRRA